jgi:hypothetical protein
MACPLCSGTGVVARGLHNHYKPIITEHNTHPCEKCETELPMPLTLEGLSGDDRERMEQFFHGGPLYCADCYPEVPPCDDCGWHIPVEDAADHVRKAHTHSLESSWFGFGVIRARAKQANRRFSSQVTMKGGRANESRLAASLHSDIYLVNIFKFTKRNHSFFVKDDSRRLIPHFLDYLQKGVRHVTL